MIELLNLQGVEGSGVGIVAYKGGVHYSRKQGWMPCGWGDTTTRECDGLRSLGARIRAGPSCLSRACRRPGGTPGMAAAVSLAPAMPQVTSVLRCRSCSNPSKSSRLPPISRTMSATDVRVHLRLIEFVTDTKTLEASRARAARMVRGRGGLRMEKSPIKSVSPFRRLISERAVVQLIHLHALAQPWKNFQRSQARLIQLDARNVPRKLLDQPPRLTPSAIYDDDSARFAAARRQGLLSLRAGSHVLRNRGAIL
eukprot:767701-Hanusia_phi.AAC.9